MRYDANIKHNRFVLNLRYSAKQICRGYHCFFACLIAFASSPINTAFADCDKANFSIAIDVGHTPQKPGAISARGVTEYGFNQRLATIIQKHLESHGFSKIHVLLTEGATQDLLRRLQNTNAIKPDLFLSVHHDSAQPQFFAEWEYQGQLYPYSDIFKGWSLFISNHNSQPKNSFKFASLLANALLKHGLPFSTHHAMAIKGEGRRFVDMDKGIYQFDNLIVLKGVHAPAVLLEAGVIVNRDEETQLSSINRQSAISESVSKAVDEYCSSM